MSQFTRFRLLARQDHVEAKVPGFALVPCRICESLAHLLAFTPEWTTPAAVGIAQVAVVVLEEFFGRQLLSRFQRWLLVLDAKTMWWSL